jgi:hypothetical protein
MLRLNRSDFISANNQRDRLKMSPVDYEIRLEDPPAKASVLAGEGISTVIGNTPMVKLTPCREQAGVRTGAKPGARNNHRLFLARKLGRKQDGPV